MQFDRAWMAVDRDGMAESSPEVTDMLQTYRCSSQLSGAVTFGANAIVLSGAGAELRVGQSVSANFRFD